MNKHRGLELRYLVDEDVLYRVLCHFQRVSIKSAGLAYYLYEPEGGDRRGSHTNKYKLPTGTKQLDRLTSNRVTIYLKHPN